mgnify:CR=1 FL=1
MIVCPGGAAPQAISTSIIIRPCHLLHLIFLWLVALSGHQDCHYDHPAALAFVVLATTMRIIIVVMGAIIIAIYCDDRIEGDFSHFVFKPLLRHCPLLPPSLELIMVDLSVALLFWLRRFTPHQRLLGN